MVLQLWLRPLSVVPKEAIPRRSPIGGCRPSFWIVGTRKGGTTALYTYLSKHPDVHGVQLKRNSQDGEVGRWYAVRADEVSADMVQEYNKKFRDVPEGKLTGDSAVGHGPSCNASKSLAVACGRENAKVIYLIRDPIDRAVSNFRMRARLGTLRSYEQDSMAIYLRTELVTAVKYLQEAGPDWFPEGGAAGCLPSRTSFPHRGPNMLLEGLYAAHLSRWLVNYSPEQIMVLTTEDMLQDTKGVLEEVSAFLGLNPSRVDWSQHISRRYNTAPEKTSPITEHLSSTLTKELRRFFAPDVRRLRSMLANSSRISATLWPTTLSSESSI